MCGAMHRLPGHWCPLKTHSVRPLTHYGVWGGCRGWGSGQPGLERELVQRQDSVEDLGPHPPVNHTVFHFSPPPNSPFKIQETVELK